MADDTRQALVLELRQIIQADRQAADIIQRAKDTRKMIEDERDKQKAAILAEADRTKAEMAEQVRAEQAQQLAQRKKQAEADSRAQRKKLDDTVEKNREAWIDEIVARITAE